MKYLMRNIEERAVSKLDRMLGFPRERSRFKRTHGYELNLKEPKSLNEKICVKKLYDRNPLMPIVADKYKVKDYLKSALGEDRAKEIDIPLIAAYDSAKDVNVADLPDHCILKSAHGSGNNLIINGSKPTQTELQKTLKVWQKEPYGLRNHEWAYTLASRTILVEELLQTSNGTLPADFKFHMLHGQCVFLTYDQDRHGNFTRSLFDKDWNFLDVAYKRAKGIPQPKPQNFESMLALAEELAKPFDYIRVDLYNVEGKIYFSELTHYPARGRGKFTPKEFDFEVGKHWKQEY